MVENFSLTAEETHLWVVPFHFINNAKPTFNANSTAISFSSSREILRYLSSRYLNLLPEELIFEKTERGKLFLPEHLSFFFSMAHSGAFLVLAFSLSPIGIDLEKKRKVKAVSLAKKFFSKEEIDFIFSEGKTKVEEKFFQLWTAKEAVLKADGRGITEGLRKTVATIKNNKITSLNLGQHLWDIMSWSIKSASQQNSVDEYAGAIAASMPKLIRWYDFASFVRLDDSCHFRTLT